MCIRDRLGALRNHAIERSTGAWCIQWDDDEWYHPDRIAVQMGAVAGDATAVALRWTLMSVEPNGRAPLAFRSDTGIATPGTVLHRRDAARYPNLARGEDSVFLRRLRDAGELVVLGKEHAYLFVRCFHGSNTWSESHFVARLHRRPADWPAYATARWWHRDLARHPACELSPREVAVRFTRPFYADPAAITTLYLYHPGRMGQLYPGSESDGTVGAIGGVRPASASARAR